MEAKLICKPGQRAIIVRTLPGKQVVPGMLGRVVRVVRLLSPDENFWIIPEYPCWKLETPLLSLHGTVFVGVYDYCLAPLPDEGDVYEHDHEEELVKEQDKELT